MFVVRRLIAVAIVIIATLALLAPPAAGQERPLPTRMQVVTDYPAVTVQSGDTITFDLEVVAPTRQPVELVVVDAPSDWELTLRGGGFVIDGVTADPADPPAAELEVAIPPTAAPQTYRFGVEGRNGTAVDRLDLSVTVADRPVGGIQLSTDFPTLRGRPADTFRYDLDITNQTPEEITFAFDGQGPEGWVVTAGPASEQRASTVTVAAGDSESVRVEADPPADTPAGTYDIVVNATGGGQSGSFTLTAEVTGQPSLELVTANGRLDLSGNPGSEIETTVLVVNDGSAPLEDVRLSADEPAEWTVEFEPEEIPQVPGGQSVPITIRIQPAGNAVAGDYALGVTARAGGESSDIAYRYSIETSLWWGAIGIVIILGAFVVLFAVFRRFGRR